MKTIISSFSIRKQPSLVVIDLRTISMQPVGFRTDGKLRTRPKVRLCSFLLSTSTWRNQSIALKPTSHSLRLPFASTWFCIYYIFLQYNTIPAFRTGRKFETSTIHGMPVHFLIYWVENLRIMDGEYATVRVSQSRQNIYIHICI